MNKSDQAFEFMFDKMLCKRTGLFYDYRVKGLNDPLTDHLPGLELIEKSIPNPCGWGTGMEDCMITGGVTLDAIISKYKSEPSEDLIIKAKTVFDGMYLCATVSNSRGFLARSVSPIDGKTHYMDSSRDQYTHWIYSSINYYRSPLSGDSEKRKIKDVLLSFADRAFENITEENDWNYLREDSKKGAVVRMWGPKVGRHEAFRLPMIYIAAWFVSRDDKYYGLYLKYRDQALEISKSIDFENKPPLPFGISQMVYSLRLAFDLDPDTLFRKNCLEYLEFLAKYSKEKFFEYSNDVLRPENVKKLSYEPVDWTQVPAYLDKYLDGYAYYVPSQLFTWREGFPMARKYLVYSACYCMVYLLCPTSVYDGEIFNRINDLINAVDYENHYTVGPIFPLGVYWELINRKNGI